MYVILSAFKRRKLYKIEKKTCSNVNPSVLMSYEDMYFNVKIEVMVSNVLFLQLASSLL